MSERAEIAYFTDLAGNEVYVGDRVAVAVASHYYTGQRLGEVLEITGVFADSRWVDIRVKVKVDTSTLSHSWGKFPYIKTYDAANRVVKL